MKPLNIFLSLSTVSFGLLASHHLVIAKNTNTALFFGALAAFQLVVLLTQPVQRRLLAQTGAAPLPLADFKYAYRRLFGMSIGILLMAWTYFLAEDAEFTPTLMLVWFIGIAWWWWVLQEGHKLPKIRPQNIVVNFHTLLFVTIFCAGGSVLLYQINDVPQGMTPDHAEKIFDLIRIKSGLTSIYFGANSGREPLHFYLAYMLSQPFDYSFLSLKFTSILYGVLMLPALYMLGRQVNGRLAGLLTMAIGAFSIWQIIHARSGFRAWSAGLMSALLIMTLWHALHQGKRQDFLLVGVVLGVGQYTYTSFRMMPLLVLGGFVLRYLVDRHSWRKLLLNGMTTFIMAAMIFIPLFNYWIHFPSVFWYRSQNMMGSGLQSSLRPILDGLIQSLTMFNFTTDPVQLNVVQGWPALGPIAGALFLMGAVYWLWRILMNRRWLELLLPMSLLVAILPSALGINAPNEMPSARRAIMAFPVVILFAGVFLSFVINQLLQQRPYWLTRTLAVVCCVGLLYTQFSVNWEGYNKNHARLIADRTENQIQIAHEIDHFMSTGGSPEKAFLVFDERFIWVDARIVALNLGLWNWHNVLVIHEHTPSEALCSAAMDGEDGPLLFIYGMGYAQQFIEEKLTECFPQQTHYYYHSEFAGQIFNVMYVPSF